MPGLHLQPQMSRREILERVLAAENEAIQLLKEASSVVQDPEERELYAELARREQQTLAELRREQGRLDAEDFVANAIEV
jgi:rubrerythrin